MSSVLTKDLFAGMLARGLAKVEEQLAYLNELDSATGDGDHGTAILSTMKAAVEASKQEATFPQTLNNIGWGIMSATGGSTSSLTGALYLGMGGAFDDESLSPELVAKIYAAGLANVSAMTTAKIGDKTMIDAMVPAIDAMKKAVADNPDVTLTEMFAAAAKAADEGAASTKDLVAKLGRAKNLGERSRGHLDAGATSFAMIMNAFAEEIAEKEKVA